MALVLAVTVALTACVALFALSLVAGLWRVRRSVVRSVAELPAAARAWTSGTVDDGTRIDDVALLQAWTLAAETAWPDQDEPIRAAARTARIDARAARLTSSKDATLRVLGAIATGNLRHRLGFAQIEVLLQDERPFVSATAAAMLVRADPTVAIRRVMRDLVARPQWHPQVLAHALNECAPDLATKAVELALAAEPRSLPSIVRLLEATRSAWCLPFVRSALERDPDDETIASCLRLIGWAGEAADIAAVRRYVHHASWFVRVQAVTALGAMATPEDARLFIDALGDREWWVRYRSAKALVALPFVGDGELEHLRMSHPDRYARDALSHAMAERGRA